MQQLDQARVLVIKLGALGDFVQAFAPFAAIRAHHPGARITLLTTAPFADLARLSPWFDSVEIDQRPRWYDLAGMQRLRAQLAGHDIIYDLQTSGRSSRYFHLAGSAIWSGIARGAARPHDNPWRDLMHTRTRQIDQLRDAGIMTVPDPDLSWLKEVGPVIAGPYALLVPGAAAHRPAKRWPVERFAALASMLDEQGIRPVLVGTAVDAALAPPLLAACPNALDLVGRTTLAELGGICARAEFALGNDTGPMHLAASMGCRCIVMFSAESNPGLTAPIGRFAGQVRVIAVRDLATLSTDRVAAALQSGH